MKISLLASVAILALGTSASFAAVPALDAKPVFAPAASADLMQLAKNGGDDSGGDDHGGNSGSGGGSGSSSHDDGDDHSGTSSDDDGDDDEGDDSASTSGSGRKKARVPGGSGCDSAGDIAEHASCTAQ